MHKGKVYLIPVALAEDGLDAIPAYIKTAVSNCSVFFVENERSARRFLKTIWKEMVIDDYTWYSIKTGEPDTTAAFRNELRAGRTIGIMSEAGCPGVADPGQSLVAIAQEEEATIHPLTGPSSILLALMASGMNGQQFRFVGYLPIDVNQRIQAIRELEADSAKKKCTQIFIETPYRNNQMLDTLLKTCNPSTRLCIAAEITSASEFIRTRTISEWKKKIPDMHKKPVIFLLMV